MSEPRPLGPNVFVGPFCTTFCPSVGVGATILTVPSIEGFVQGDLLSVMMDNGVIFQVGLLAIGDGSLTLAAPLPYPASCGNQVCDLRVSANLPPATIAFADGTPFSPINEGDNLAAIGTVNPVADAASCQMAVSNQNLTPPVSGWVTATFSSPPLFECDLGPQNTVGTIYVWARDPLTGSTAVSTPVEVAAAPPLTVQNPPAFLAIEDSVYNNFIAQGTVVPTMDSVEAGLSLSNTEAPTDGLIPLTNDGSGSLSGTISVADYAQFVEIGDYYLWLVDTVNNNSVVSANPVSVNDVWTNTTQLDDASSGQVDSGGNIYNFQMGLVTGFFTFALNGVYAGQESATMAYSRSPDGSSPTIFAACPYVSTNGDGSLNFTLFGNFNYLPRLESADQSILDIFLVLEAGSSGTPFYTSGTVSLAFPYVNILDVIIGQPGGPTPAGPYAPGTPITIGIALPIVTSFIEESTAPPAGYFQFALSADSVLVPDASSFADCTFTGFTGGAPPGDYCWSLAFDAPSTPGSYYLWFKTSLTNGGVPGSGGSVGLHPYVFVVT